MQCATSQTLPTPATPLDGIAHRCQPEPAEHGEQARQDAQYNERLARLQASALAFMEFLLTASEEEITTPAARVRKAAASLVLRLRPRVIEATVGAAVTANTRRTSTRVAAASTTTADTITSTTNPTTPCAGASESAGASADTHEPHAEREPARDGVAKRPRRSNTPTVHAASVERASAGAGLVSDPRMVEAPEPHPLAPEVEGSPMLRGSRRER
jgi:hypothetical protein